MKIPLYDKNMNFVTAYELSESMANILNKRGFAFVPIARPVHMNYGDYLDSSYCQVRIRLEHFIRNGEKHPFYFVEGENDAIEALKNFDTKQEYDGYSSWKKSQVEKYTKSSSPSVLPSAGPPYIKALTSISTSAEAEEDIPTKAPIEDDDDFLSNSPSWAPEEEPKAGDVKDINGKTFVYNGSQWFQIAIQTKPKPLKIEKVEKKKKKKKKEELPKKKLTRTITFD